MAAYAAVVSLMNTMDAIMNHPRLSTSLDKEQIQSLCQKFGVLLQFIEDYNSHGVDEEADCLELERKIASAAHTAEDVIESHIVDQIHAGVLDEAPSLLIDLHEIIQGIHHLKEEVAQVEEKRGSKNKKRKYSSAAASSQPLTTGKTTMVGFSGHSRQLLDGLTGLESRRQVIPIVGMGGIGKTTLARNTYENLLTLRDFDVCAWVSISQHYNVRKIFIQLLSSLGQPVNEKLEENNEQQLSERLYKFLCGRRYLIILDDMWSFTVWDRIRFFFPEDNNSSRIVVTTRLLEVANYFGSSRVVVMDLLDDNASWDLFCDKAFTQQGCPAELEQIGKTIAKKCKGLPLSIVVIGALLGKSSRMKEYWENVAEDINMILNSAEDNQCYNILSLSYNHLPARLKPCFLYLGIFPEDHEMHVSQLIKLWVAEGFIKADKDQSLEEAAESYINDLFGRNLILVGSLGWNRRCETFYIHDLVRDLCVRVAEKEKFFCARRALETPQGMDRERHIVIREGTTLEYLDQDFHTLKSTSTARSLIGEWGDQPLFECRLLRVLFADCNGVRNYFPGVAFEQVNMRLLHYKCAVPLVTLKDTYKLPRSISLLWNLQTLILVFDGLLDAPAEIWKIQLLRHLEFWQINLPDPPLSDKEDVIVLHNLQTLMTVEDFRCSEEVCKRIPNIKRLHLHYTNFSGNHYCVQNVGRLNKLESLSLGFALVPDLLVQNLKFRTSLKELSLWNCCLDWDDLRIIGWLPHLEVLKLLKDSFTGEEWNPVEGEFLRLKYLEIGCYVLKKWNVESSHFPVLDTLVLSYLLHLDGIPSAIGDIPTLTVIRVERCSISVAVSAMKILEEQDSMGNDALQIQLEFRGKTVVEDFMEQVKMEGITCTNFQLNYIDY